jgi:glycosyltransferase involved in cell wall biosynthesis
MSSLLEKTVLSQLRVAVLIPCLNEASAIGNVVKAFRKSVPDALIYVYDNGSTDKTVEIAREAGAIVRAEGLRGKGNVVCRMFSDIEADLYLLVDGDDTYDADAAPALINRLIDGHHDMVCAVRIAEHDAAYRKGHRFGNLLLTGLVSKLFHGHVRDMLSGYRVFSRRFVKSFPTQSLGFEIETQFTIHAMEMRLSFDEMDTPYRKRMHGSNSKLNTFQDGWRILQTIGYLVKEERPLAFFFAIFAVFSFSSVLLAWPVVAEFMSTGLVPRFPTAILSTGLMILAFLSLASGLILDSVANGRREMKRLHYLAVESLSNRIHQLTHKSSQ